jgi:uncharacterized protein YkwD
MRHALVVLLTVASLTGGFAQVKSIAPAIRKAPAKPTPVKSKLAAKPAALGPSQAERVIFDSANRERTARNLPLLRWNTGLAVAARRHAQAMAQKGALSHQFPGEPAMGMRIRLAGVQFNSAAENVAQGPSAAVLHDEWMNSPAHRDNILDPELDSIGVAVVERNGELFAVQDFALATR